MALVTYGNVVEAAESLIANGQKASVRNVIKQIGGGSPNAVLKLLGEYKSGRPVIRVADVDLDPSIIAAIKRQMQLVAVDATTAAEERAASLTDDLQTLSEAQQLAEQQIETLTTAKARLEAAVLELTSKLHDYELDAAQKLQTAQVRIEDLAADLAKERDRANGAMQDLGKAQSKAETVPALETQIGKLQGDLEAARKERADADQRTAVAEARIQLVAEQASKSSADLAKVEAKHAGEHKQMRTELDDARQQIKDAVAEARAARDQAAELRGQLAVVQLSNSNSKGAEKDPDIAHA